MLDSAVLLGMFLGMRHATDVDHVVLVSTVLRERRGPRAALSVVARWALGHTATFLLVGLAMVIFGVRTPRRFEQVAELLVGLMLVAIGVHEWVSRVERRARHHLRPVAIGLVHGLAGSSGIALLALASIGSRTSAALYLFCFGLGTVLGMVLITALLAVPLDLATRRPRLERGLVRAAATLAIAVGVSILVTTLRTTGDTP